MGKGLHKLLLTVVKEIFQELTPLGESGSEVSHFIPEPRKFAEVKKLSENIKKPWLKATLKEIKNLIKNYTFLIEDQNEGKPVTPCMDVYKAKIQSDGIHDKLKLNWINLVFLMHVEMDRNPKNGSGIHNSAFVWSGIIMRLRIVKSAKNE